MRVFSCEGCIAFRKDGWPTFKAAGGWIKGGPCGQRVFYSHEAARTACKGELYKSKIEEDASPMRSEQHGGEDA